MTVKKFSDKDPPGYERFLVYSHNDGHLGYEELLLPADEETRRHIKDLKRLAEKKQEQLLVVEVRAAIMDTKDRSVFGTRKKASDDLDLDEERKHLESSAQSDASLKSQDHVSVYSWDEPLKLISQGKSATFDREVRDRSRELYLRLKAKGHLRQIAHRPNVQDTLERLEQLRASQPHFGAVIDLVRDQVRLFDARQLPLRLPAILLLGEPGVGKTHFSQALAADVFTAPIHRHAFDTATTESALLGSDKRWSNTTHGLVFQDVCLGDHANPVILLDEIDKALKDDRVDPLAPLHTLLEPITATSVRDISVDLEFDCSHIIWIATANEPSRIPSPLRSRFIEFHIDPPRGEMAIQVAQAIANTIHAGMALPGFEAVGLPIVKLIAHLSAREQRQALERAFAAAIANSRNSLERQDLPLEVQLAGLDDSTGQGGNSGNNDNNNDNNPQSSGWLH